MRASGDALRQIAALIDDGALRPIVGKVIPFEQLPEALGSLAHGGIRGKVVVSVPSRADGDAARLAGCAAS